MKSYLNPKDERTTDLFQAARSIEHVIKMLEKHGKETQSINIDVLKCIKKDILNNLNTHNETAN